MLTNLEWHHRGDLRKTSTFFLRATCSTALAICTLKSIDVYKPEQTDTARQHRLILGGINPYVAIGVGGILPPICTFYPVAPKPLKIVTVSFVTFPEYMWAKKYKFSDISTSCFNMMAGKWTPNEKKLKNPNVKALFGFQST